MKTGQELSTEDVESSLSFLQQEDWGFQDNSDGDDNGEVGAPETEQPFAEADGGGGDDNGSSDSYYTQAVQQLLGWLVRNGCAIDRLDNHWECGVGSSGAVHTQQQPPHWNAIHASIHIPPSVRTNPLHPPAPLPSCLSNAHIF